MSFLDIKRSQGLFYTWLRKRFKNHECMFKIASNIILLGKTFPNYSKYIILLHTLKSRFLAGLDQKDMLPFSDCL